MDLSLRAARSEQVSESSTAGATGPSSIALPLCAALMALQFLGVALGRMVLPVTNASHGTVAAHLLSWDANYYFGIAKVGYVWDPALAAHHYQDVAFFPLQALIDRFAILFGGSSAKALILVFTLAAGLASIIAFERLANMLLRHREATLATICFGFWPASSFYLMGYPTGLISLFVILAFHDYLAGRFWRSGVWIGLGTAAAPTVVFVGAGVGIHSLARWLHAGAHARGIVRLAGWALLALSGVLGFMLYQWIALGDPLAFVHAQIAWGTAPAPLARIRALFDVPRYLQQPRAGLAEIHQAATMFQATVSGKAGFLLAMGVQRIVNFATFALALVALLVATASLRGRADVVSGAGWAVFLGYVWFILSTAQNMLATPRLLFPALAIFAGLGIILGRLPVSVRMLFVALLGILSVGEMAAAAAGYWVV